jgi:hypothetical protein
MKNNNATHSYLYKPGAVLSMTASGVPENKMQEFNL